MNTVAIICSRKDAPAKELNILLKSFEKQGIDHSIQFDAPSIYEGHAKGAEILNVQDDDTIILCHDDIELISTDVTFWLNKYLDIPNTGFVGVAGATRIENDGMWWNIERRQKDLLRGFVFQGNDILTMRPNYFGAFGARVVCLDGVFIACKGTTFKKYCGFKPKWNPGKWDFYDVGTTLQAYEDGLTNYVVPIILRHVSSGLMRQEWYTAKDAFVKNFRLPIYCR